jgi:peptidyl-prolyl cis-trans isomerase D
MFDFVHKNKRVVQIVLGVMILPFAFVGVDSYVRQMGSEQDLATVDGKPVTAPEFENALRAQQEQMRGMLGKNYDPAMFESPEVRQQVLDSVINQRLLQAKAVDLALTAPDAELKRVILEIPSFQENGKFSEAVYDDVLKRNGRTRLSFEQSLRADISQQPLQDALARSGFASSSQVTLFQQITEQGRAVQIATLPADAVLSQVKIDDAKVREEYDTKQDAFRAPEQVKIEYLQLSQAALLPLVSISAEEVKSAYDLRVKEFSAPEERKASHILLSFEKDDKGKPKSDSRDAAKSEAEALMKQSGSSAEKFAELAKSKSKDSGSAAQGGDLGFFGRGQMVKAFDEAVFAMKPGEVRGPIETDFGFHVIRLVDIKAERTRPLEEVKAQIESELKQQAASKRFNESAEKFQNRVYEQADSYTKLAEELKLEVKKTDWMTRSQIQGIAAGNQKFAEAVFAPASVAAKKNSEAIDLGNNSLISARVVEYKASEVRPFDDVKAQILTQLQRRAATDLTVKMGQEKLKAVAAGAIDPTLTFAPAQTLLRQRGLLGVNAALSKEIFAADVSKGLAYVGGPNDGGGYTVARVVKIVEPEAANAEKNKSLGQRLVGQGSADITTAYLTALKDSIKVQIRPSAVTKPAAKDAVPGEKSAQAPTKS